MTIDCQSVRELLPWHLAGNLDRGEGREVAAHLETCEDCSEELARTERVAVIAASHVPTAVLTRYAFGEERVELDRPILERHLAHCASCREELALAEAAAAAAPAPAPRRAWPALALAASLFVGLGLGILWRPAPTGGPGPRGDVALVELLPESLSLRGSDEAARLPADRPITLVAITDLAVGDGRYRARLLAPGGGELWTLPDIEPTEAGTFVVHLPDPSTVAEGSSLVLEVEEADGWRRLESYALSPTL